MARSGRLTGPASQSLYFQRFHDSTLSSVTGDPSITIWPLDAWPTFTRTMGTQADDCEGDRVFVKYDLLDIKWNIGNEKESINHTIYVVTLKSAIGPALDYSTGALTLANGTHFWQVGGRVYLNLTYFTIKKKKAFWSTNTTVALDANNPTTLALSGVGPKERRWRWMLKRNYMHMTEGANFQNQIPRNPAHMAYVLWFTNDSSVDLEGTNASMVHLRTCKQVF